MWQLSNLCRNKSKSVKKSLEQSSSSLVVAPKSHHGYVVWDPVTIEIECNEALSFKSFIKRGILEVFGWKTINLISRHLNLFTRYSDTTSTPAAVGPRRQPIGGFTFRIKKCDRKSELEHSGLYQFYDVQKCRKTWANPFFFVTTNIFSLLCFYI